MGASSGGGPGAVVGFECFGVRVRVSCDTQEVAARLTEVLPPAYTQIAADVEAEEFGLVGEGRDRYTFNRGGSPVSSDIDLEFGITLLQTQVQLFIGLKAAGRMFVHAGAVAIGGQAVIFPGRSFSGKTRLVAAFLEHGATYLSDEFAVIDAEAMVHPFPTRLSLRVGDDQREYVDPTDLGGVKAEARLPLGAIVVANYRPGATWAPEELTRGRASLALLDNTIAALARHGEALAVFRHATQGPLLLAGERGDAEPVVRDLFSRLAPLSAAS